MIKKGVRIKEMALQALWLPSNTKLTLMILNFEIYISNNT